MKILGKVKTGTEMIAIFRELKAYCWLVVHVQILLLPVRSKKKYATFENL